MQFWKSLYSIIGISTFLKDIFIFQKQLHNAADYNKMCIFLFIAHNVGDYGHRLVFSNIIVFDRKK